MTSVIRNNVKPIYKQQTTDMPLEKEALKTNLSVEKLAVTWFLKLVFIFRNILGSAVSEFWRKKIILRLANCCTCHFSKHREQANLETEWVFMKVLDRCLCHYCSNTNPNSPEEEKKNLSITWLGDSRCLFHSVVRANSKVDNRGKKFWLYPAGNTFTEKVSISESNIQTNFFRADNFRYL